MVPVSTDPKYPDRFYRRMKAIIYVTLEILSLFILGIVYYLFQKRKYIRLHEEKNREFIQKIKDIDPEFPLSEDTQTFERQFTVLYRQHKDLEHYPEELRPIFEDYLDYLESISGPLI